MGAAAHASLARIKMAMRLAAAAALVLVIPGAALEEQDIVEGLAVIDASPSGVSGSVRFVKGCGCSVLVRARLAGFRPNAKLGFHVHEFGNLTAGCVSAGDHWNPANVSHGAPDSPNSHAGDLGNAASDADGKAEFVVRNPTMSKLGLGALYGRSIVIHNMTDDLGLGGSAASLANGMSGARIACGVIGRTNVTALRLGGGESECLHWLPPPRGPGTPVAAASNGFARGIAAFGGRGGASDGVSGGVSFVAADDCTVVVSGVLRGLRPNAKLGFHVHELGDLSGGCATTGLHWNPTGSSHGAPNSNPSYAGDLGNVITDEDGVATVLVSNRLMTEPGVSALFGRALIVHNATDDLGLGGSSASLANGNSGARVACAIVGRANRGGSDGPCLPGTGAAALPPNP